MVDITKQRKEEILKIYKEKTDLFNWCEEYKQFISECVHCCVSSEWDYILKKSVEDGDAPFSYEDIDSFDEDAAIEILIDDFDNNKEASIEYANDSDTYNRRVKNKGDFEVFLKSLDLDEVKEAFEELGHDPYEVEFEIYEWWIISDPLKYRLEEQGQTILNGAWGRCTTGQHISLDYCCRKAFLSFLEDLYKY